MSVAILAGIAFPSPAPAYTTHEVVARAQSWVDRNVPYSQKRSFEGYRTDCSGFVSMAWGLDESYTTRSISTKGTPVALGDLEPGDAILTPGHIVIFAGWANTEHTTFLALEEANRRLGSVARVKDLPANGRGLRSTDLTESPRPGPSPDETAAAAAERIASADEAARCLERAGSMVEAVADARASHTIELTVEVAGALA